MGYLEDILAQQEKERQYTLEMTRKAREEGYRSLEDYFANLGLLHSGIAVRQISELEKRLLEPIQQMELQFSRERMALAEQIKRAKTQQKAQLLTGALTALGLVAGLPFGSPTIGASIGGAAGSLLASLVYGTTPVDISTSLGAAAYGLETKKQQKAFEEMIRDWIKTYQEYLKGTQPVIPSPVESPKEGSPNIPFSEGGYYG